MGLWWVGGRKSNQFMKTLFEDSDVEAIALRVVEMMKPFLSKNGSSTSEDVILDKKALAEYLSVPVSWIDKKVSLGEIPYTKIGKYIRFKKSAIDRWIEKQSVRLMPLSKSPINRG